MYGYGSYHNFLHAHDHDSGGYIQVMHRSGDFGKAEFLAR